MARYDKSMLVMVGGDHLFHGTNHRINLFVNFIKKHFRQVTIVSPNNDVKATQELVDKINSNSLTHKDLIYKETKENNVKYYLIPPFLGYKDMPVVMKSYVPLLLKNQHYDICYSHGVEMTNLPKMLKESGIVDHTVYLDVDYTPGFEYGDEFKKAVMALEELSIESNDLVISVSQELAALRQNKYPKKNIFASQNGVRYDLFAKAQSASRTEPIMIYTGWLGPTYGVQFPIYAMPQIIKEVPQAKYMIIGFGDEAYKQTLQHIANDLGVEKSVVFLDKQPYEKLPDFLRQARIGISTFKNSEINQIVCPLKVFEYFAAGLPVLGADFGGLGRIMQESKAGIKTKNIDDIAAGAIKLFKDEQLFDTYQKNAIQYAQNYDVDNLLGKELETVVSFFYKNKPIESTSEQVKSICNICGSHDGFDLTNPEGPRESWVCRKCGSTSRDRMYIFALATAMKKTEPLADWSVDKSIKVLEAAGARAHPQILDNKFDYNNTKFDPEIMEQPGYDLDKYADFQALRNSKESLDIVMSSDVFEHIRLHTQALQEIHRVLKPGGTMILQVPMSTDREETVVRVKPEGDKDNYLMPAHYHAEHTLVYRDFGLDIIAQIENCGFQVEKIDKEIPEFCITPQKIFIVRKPEKAISDDINKRNLQMKKDWNDRANEDAFYYVHSSKRNQTEEEFNTSGRKNVKELISDQLQIIASDTNPKSMKVLEIGCGLGRMTKHIADIFGEVYGVDVSGEMIKQARKRLKSQKNIYLYENNGYDLSEFKGNYFDFIFSFIVFQHIPSKDAVFNYIREAYRVMKPNAVFKFQVQGCLDPGWLASQKDTWQGVTITEEEVIIIANELGFDILDKSGKDTQYSWYMLQKTDPALHVSNERLEIDKSKADKKHPIDISKQTLEYKTKIQNEIATYEHVTDVHQLPEIHGLYGREFLTSNIQKLTGCKGYQSWWIDEIKKLAKKLKRPVNILSLACGNGDTEINLIKRLNLNKKVKITGVDINPAMVERGTQLAKENNLDNVKFEVHDLNFLNLNETFDVVLANHSLHHIVNLENMFEEIDNKTSKNFVFLINDMIGRNGHVMWDNTAQVVNALWNELDEKYKLNAYSKQYDSLPFNIDCSQSGFEGIRAQDILSNLKKYFDFELFLPFSVIMNRFVERTYGHNFNVKDQNDVNLIKKILSLDVKLLQENKLSPTQAFIKVRKKGTVKNLAWLFQKPDQVIESRKFELKESDYLQDVINLSENQQKEIEDKSSDNQKVSIIIPVFNNLNFTKKCLKTIFKNTQHPDFEILIVDNASTDGTADYLRNLKDIRVKPFYKSQNEGFVNACNLGAKNASGKYVLLLNNDTEVQPGWLTSLVNFAEENHDCGAIGSKLVYPDGTLQEAGAIIFSDGNGWNFGRGGSPQDPRFNFVREVDYCSGAALMVNKNIWDKIGGFDQRYSPAYYEDTDMCFSIRKLGFKVYYHPHSVVIHHEGKTAGTDLQSGYKKYQLVNHKKFVDKWKAELKEQYANNPENVVKASEKSTTKNIIVFDPFLPFFDRASGSLRLFHILKILKKMQFHVTFIARDGALEKQYKQVLENLGIETFSWDTDALRFMGVDLKDLPSTVNYEILFKDRQYDYAIIDFWTMAEYYLPIIRKYSPKTKIIVDSIDIHFVRELREAELKKVEAFKKAALKNKTKELNVYKQADRVWVVTERDKHAIKNSINKVPIDIVPNIHEKITVKKNYDETSDLLFVGNFNHTPNRDAVEFLCKNIMPEIRKKLPEIKLYIVGNNPTKEVQKFAGENVIVTGYVEDLKPHLKEARISVNPLRYGAGMKGKIGEALSWGLPVVTTSIGAEGMEIKNNEHALVADEAKDFAEKVVDLYQNKDLWENLSRGGKKLVSDKWNPDSIKREIKNIFAIYTTSDEMELPIVSIIMLTFNALEFTKKCVESIQEYTKNPHEIIFVDNGSKDGTKKYLRQLIKKHQNYQLISNNKNQGFAEGNNQGVKKAKGKYILLLNNDVEVSNGWLESMVRSLELDEKIGMVGPITNMISGLQQVSQIDYTDQNGFHQFAQKVRQQNEGVITPRRRIAGFAVLMEKMLYEEIGGFDTSFGTGNYEDDDLCLRVWEKGYAIMVDESTFIHHYGSRTFDENKIDYKKSLKNKENIFSKKWPNVDHDELLELKNPLFREHETKIEKAFDLLTGGECDRALEIFKSILIENPISGEGLLGGAYCYRNLNNTVEAITYLKKLTELQPDNAIAFNQLGLISAESGDFDNAKTFFIASIEKDPMYIDAQRNYAEILIQLEQYEEGIVTMKTILENHPEDIATMNSLAQLYLEANMENEAKELVERAISLDPENIVTIKLADDLKITLKGDSEEYQDLLEIGLQKLENGEFEESLKVYKGVLEKSPDNVDALYGSGLAYQFLGNHDLAMDMFSKTITAVPTYIDAYNSMGLLLMQKQEFDKAIDMYQKILEIDPANVNCQLNIADALIESGNYEEGIQSLKLVLKNNPSEINALLRMGNLYLEASNYKEATSYFNKVLEIDPDNEIAKQAMTMKQDS